MLGIRESEKRFIFVLFTWKKTLTKKFRLKIIRWNAFYLVYFVFFFSMEGRDSSRAGVFVCVCVCVWKSWKLGVHTLLQIEQRGRKPNWVTCALPRTQVCLSAIVLLPCYFLSPPGSLGKKSLSVCVCVAILTRLLPMQLK